MSGRTLYCLGEAWLELESPAPLSSAEAFRPRVGGSAAALALAPLEWIYYASAILIGFGFGIFIPTFQTMKLNMADRGHRGAVNSTFFTAFDIGVGTGMFLGGKIYAYLNLNWAFGTGALLNLLAIVYFYRISLDHYRKNKLGVDSD